MSDNLSKVINFLNEIGNNKLQNKASKEDCVPILNVNDIVITRRGDVFIVDVDVDRGNMLWLSDEKYNEQISVDLYNDKLEYCLEDDGLNDIIQIYSFCGVFKYNTIDNFKSLVKFKNEDITLVWERPNEK